MSTTVFIALNSTEFCNKYLFSEKSEEPLLSIPQFIFLWASIQMLITLYILFFVPEKIKVKVDDGSVLDQEEEEDEVVILPS